jgi:hypothetical protein
MFITYLPFDLYHFIFFYDGGYLPSLFVLDTIYVFYAFVS